MSEQCAPSQTGGKSLVWIGRLSGSRGLCPFPLAARPSSQATPSLRGPPGTKLLLFSLPHTHLKPQKPHKRCSLDPPVCGPATSARGDSPSRAREAAAALMASGIDRL